jgi:hypothetical protein
MCFQDHLAPRVALERPRNAFSTVVSVGTRWSSGKSAPAALRRLARIDDVGREMSKKISPLSAATRARIFIRVDFPAPF